MYELIVDHCAVLRESVTGFLEPAPVVTCAPVFAQSLRTSQVGPVLPRRVSELVGPARTCESVAQIRDDVVGDLNLEGNDLSIGHAKTIAFVGALTYNHR